MCASIENLTVDRHGERTHRCDAFSNYFTFFEEEEEVSFYKEKVVEKVILNVIFIIASELYILNDDQHFSIHKTLCFCFTFVMIY